MIQDNDLITLNPFEESENIGRAKFETFYNQYLTPIGYNKLIFNKDPYGRYDILVMDTLNKKILVVEVKNRSNKYTRFKDVFAEKAKIDSLVEIADKYRVKYDKATVKPMYFYSYDKSDTIRYILPEAATDFKILTSLCNITTAVKSVKKDKVVILYKDYKELTLN